jgi:hypothetical protein
MNEPKDRMGTSFERLVADMFHRIGFTTRTNVFTNKENGQRSEQDVLAEKANLKILIQCKDYAKFPDIKLEETIQDLIEDGESMEANTLILTIIGLKDSSRWKNYAKEKGVYLWDEFYWRKLQRLDLYDLIHEIGKNLEIEEVLRRITKKEEEELKKVYENIKSIKDPHKRANILKELEKINLSDEVKKTVQIKKVENEILIEKQNEIEEIIKKREEEEKEKSEDIELEELSKLIKVGNLDYSRRYGILEKIKNELNLSGKSGRIIDVEKIKTFIEKQQEESENENWGDTPHVDLEKLYEEGKISENDKEALQYKIRQTVGISKDGKVKSQKLEIQREIDKAILRRKIYKTLIALGIWIASSLILWRILF